MNYDYITEENTSIITHLSLCTGYEGIGMGLGDYRVIVSKQGTETWIRGSAVPLRDTDGDVIGAALVFRTADASGTDEDNAVALCRHASRMETIDRTTGRQTAVDRR